MSQGEKRLRASVVCERNDQILLVYLCDPVTKITQLFPPGGGVEKGETPEQAAVRETLEETGYEIEIVPELHRVDLYPFKWGEKLFDCTTHFFGARLKNPKKTPKKTAPEAIIHGVKWVPKEDVAEALSFNQDIQNSVLALIPGL